MYPALNFNECVTIYELTTNDYGKDVLGDDTEVKALYEQVTGFGHGGFQDSINGTSRIYLDGDNKFVLENAYRLEGMIIMINPFDGSDAKQYFRIVNVTVARDILRKNKVRHVECELAKTADFDNEA